jgi:succinylarginine dihydrolase
MSTSEFNFDGLIGPTHNYAGLSYGNVASAKHQNQTSSPRQAALQGLAKMKRLAEIGVGQAILPPLCRPRLSFLRQLGLFGSPAQLVDAASKIDPALLATCYSASNMWTANAATVSPSDDSVDGRLHLTVANLSSTLHRSIEHPSTWGNLNAIFAAPEHFAVHPALPSQLGLNDEGAANHTRLHPQDSQGGGIQLFVFGVDSLNRSSASPKRFPARQTRLASESVARLHQLDSARTFFWQQNPQAIDAGVFHNDVISVGHQNVLLCHEMSFVDQVEKLQQIKLAFEQLYDQPLFIVEFSSNEISLKDAVASYLFNSQLVTRPDGGITVICPLECESIPAAKNCVQRLIEDTNPVDKVEFLDLRQSMNNGGGPACLRLRVSMTAEEQANIHQGILFTPALYDRLTQWVQTHYRNKLHPDDLRDPVLIDEVQNAFDDLSKILQLPNEVLCDRQ